jgi:hypothetical protein
MTSTMCCKCTLFYAQRLGVAAASLRGVWGRGSPPKESTLFYDRSWGGGCPPTTNLADFRTHRTTVDLAQARLSQTNSSGIVVALIVATIMMSVGTYVQINVETRPELNARVWKVVADAEAPERVIVEGTNEDDEQVAISVKRDGVTPLTMVPMTVDDRDSQARSALVSVAREAHRLVGHWIPLPGQPHGDPGVAKPRGGPGGIQVL